MDAFAQQKRLPDGVRARRMKEEMRDEWIDKFFPPSRHLSAAAAATILLRGTSQR